MPRSAVKVTKSPQQHLGDLNHRAQDLEKQLAACSSGSNKNSDESKANKLRIPLCEVLSDILLTDAHYAAAHDVTGRLWRHCFYSRIGPQRSKIQKQKNKQARKQQQPSNNNSVLALEQNLQFFLSEAVTLYDYLADKLQSKLVGHSAGSGATASSSSTVSSAAMMQGNSSYSLSGSVLVQQRPKTQHDGGVPPLIPAKTDNSLVVCLHQLYVHLGDLYRYSQQLKKAERAYQTAAALGPGHGHAYNQLAVLCQVKDQQGMAPLTAVSLYWYTRSLLANIEPFMTSRVNLARLLQNNQDWLGQNKSNIENDPQQQSKSAQSRLFLAQFVNFHAQLFQNDWHATLNTMAAETMRAFADLLKNSALGDALLCKLVTIQAFSEMYSPATGSNGNDNSDDHSGVRNKSTLIAVAARLSTLQFGRLLAERLLEGSLPKLLQQQQDNKNNNKSSTSLPPSVRLLLPLLLLAHYVHAFPMPQGSDPREGMQEQQLLDKAASEGASFWKRIVDVWNLLHRLVAAVGEDDEFDEAASAGILSLKELQNLRGYAPFISFLEDKDTSTVLTAGFVSESEAVQVLQLNSPQDTGSGSASRVSQDSATLREGSTAAPQASAADQGKIKVAKFLALGRRLAEITDGPMARFRLRRPGGKGEEVLEWIDNVVVADNINMSEPEYHETVSQDHKAFAESSSNGGGVPMEVEAPTPKENNKDMLVYQQGSGGGPALLVPSHLLQGQQLSGTDTGGNGFAARSASNAQAPVSRLSSLVPGLASNDRSTTEPMEGVMGSATNKIPLQQFASTATAQKSEGVPLAGIQHALGSSAMLPSSNDPAGAGATMPTAREPPPSTAAVVMPPPGFGAPAAAPTQPPTAEQAFQRSAYPHQQGYSPLIQQQQQQQHSVPDAVLASSPHVPTVADSLDGLFGGAAALRRQTANPFAFAPAPTNNASSRLFGKYSQTAREETFLDHDEGAVDGATLLDSSLLNSLMMDDANGQKTKNPFAT